MTAEDMNKFDRLMKDYYCNRASKLDGQNKVLWNMAIDLVRAISEADYASIGGLKSFGEEKTSELRTMLEREMGP